MPAVELRDLDPRIVFGALGLSPAATEEEVRARYKSLALTFHPDRTRGDVRKAEVFKQVKEAYEIITRHFEQRNRAAEAGDEAEEHDIDFVAAEQRKLPYDTFVIYRAAMQASPTGDAPLWFWPPVKSYYPEGESPWTGCRESFLNQLNQLRTPRAALAVLFRRSEAPSTSRLDRAADLAFGSPGLKLTTVLLLTILSFISVNLTTLPDVRCNIRSAERFPHRYVAPMQTSASTTEPNADGDLSDALTRSSSSSLKKFSFYVTGEVHEALVGQGLTARWIHRKLVSTIESCAVDARIAYLDQACQKQSTKTRRSTTVDEGAKKDRDPCLDLAEIRAFQAGR